jgi:alpha-tubulin suppressor-like RCC1 family protein
MSKIACKMKNSFGIDNNGMLYTWGSSDNGLIGNDSEGDVGRPNQIELKHENNVYLADRAYAGHFHAAIIADRKGMEPIRHIKGASTLFKTLHKWFETVFIRNVPNVKSFVCFMIRLHENTKEAKFDEFEKLFLRPFYAYQQLRKKDIFKMEKAYQNTLRNEFGLAADKNDVELKNILSKLETTNIKTVQEINHFAEYCVTHFKNHPDDLPFFIRLVTQFKSIVNSDEVRNLFEYCFGNYWENPGYNNFQLDQEILKKINELCSEIKIAEKMGKMELEVNKLIDTIMGPEKRTGLGILFTFGVKEEGRLGILEPNDDLLNEVDEGDIRICKYPRIVQFPNTFTKIIKVALGYAHTCVITSDHTVFTWGSGKYGCLGNSRSENAFMPQLIDADFDGHKFTNIKDISAGMYFCLALNNEGVLFSWGCGSNGRLGHSDENSVGSPKIIKYLEENNVKIMSISSGDIHSCIISSSKELYSFGNGSYGKLGHGSYEDMKRPYKLEAFVNSKVDQVICGSYNTMAITTDERIFAWGKNAHGMLGLPQLMDCNILLPQQVLFKSTEYNVSIKEITLGTMHSLILMSNGAIYACGNTSNGVLGIPNVFDKVSIPKKIPDFVFFVSVLHDITKDTIYEAYNHPEMTLNVPKSRLANSVIQVSCSTLNTAFLTNNGELYMCGESKLIYPENEKAAANYVLGPDEDKKDMMTWVNRMFKIDFERINEKVSYIALGKDHAICIADCRAYSWGSAMYGKLGLTYVEQKDYVYEPSLIEKVLSNVKMCCVSDTHSMLLTANGEIYAFGLNAYGKLGVGELTKYVNEKADTIEPTTPVEIEPVLVKNIIFASYIACSNNHSACIMKSDSNFQKAYSVYTWGSGYSGKLGHSDNLDICEPKKVEELESYKVFFVNIALGDEFTLALDLNNDLWGWGKNIYLGISSTTGDCTSVPKMLCRERKFKHISAYSHYCLAVDYYGFVYAWGKIIREDKSEIIKFDISRPVKVEPAKYVSCGFNHFAVISESNLPYTWGSNSFFKCGQMAGGNSNDINPYLEYPEKLDFFTNLFEKNKQQLKYNKDHVVVEISLVNEEKNPTQSKLLDEKMKNQMILSEDIRLNSKFFDELQDYFQTIRNLEDVRLKAVMSAENKIISIINKCSVSRSESFTSEIPKIIGMNLQLYEAFINILQMHPCYLVQVYDILPQRKHFIELIRIIYGRNYINLENRRVIQGLLGLWNGMSKQEEKEILSSEQERCRELVTFDIYDLIFKIGSENLRVVYELTAEVFILFIREICSSERTNFVYTGDDTDIVAIYRELKDFKTDICAKAIEQISFRITDLFQDMKENLVGNYSFSITWIYKRITYIFKDSIKAKNIMKFSKFFNFLLFVPFVDLLKKIIDAYDESTCYEYQIIVKYMGDILMSKNVIRNEYSQLFNLYTNDSEKVISTLFKKVIHPKSDILKQIYDIFRAMMNGDVITRKESERLHFVNKKTENCMNEMNRTCIRWLKELEYDFSLTSLKEIIKNTSEQGNKSFAIPIAIKDLIFLQQSFVDLKDRLKKKHDPLKIILEKLSEIKLDSLDSNSNIKNFVLNIYITPYSFLFQKSMTPILLKCNHCLLPVNNIFYDKDEVNWAVDGKPWRCKSCEHHNSGSSVKCSSCGKFVEKEKINNQFFKSYRIKHGDTEDLLFEDVLYHLPSLFKKDDIVKAVKNEITVIKLKKDMKEANKLALLEKFDMKVTEAIGANEDLGEFENKKKAHLHKLTEHAETNIYKRAKHVQYLTQITDLLNFIKTRRENAISDVNQFQDKCNEYAEVVIQGISNQNFKEQSPLVRILKQNKPMDKESIINKYSVIQLLDEKVIDEILFENQPQPRLAQKSYLLVEKLETGYKFKLAYIEKFRRFIICGIQNHEYILEEGEFLNERVLEMRRSARTNPTFSECGIRFNIFYLIKLLNAIEE